jgi:hypothetical protein
MILESCIDGFSIMNNLTPIYIPPKLGTLLFM